MWDEDQRANRNIVQSSSRLIRTTIFAEHLGSLISPLEVVKPRNSVVGTKAMSTTINKAMKGKELFNLLRPRFPSIVIQAIVVVLSSSVQVNRATTITVSPSSMVSSSSVLQRDFTTMPSWSVVRTSTSSFQSTSVVYSSPKTFPSSPASSMTNSVVKSKFTKTATTSVSCVTLTSSISVTQYKHTAVHVTPTKVVITRIRGIPSMTIITVIASVLGAILLLLLAIIIWDLCIVHVLPWRPTSRVEPRGDVSHVRSDMV